MVYFANKTRNHAKGFRIQKHLLAANESCVPISQNCCATDFRKTMIRFVARQVPRRIPPRKFGVPGRLAPFSSTRGAFPYKACRIPARRIHRKTSRRSSQNCEDVRRCGAHNEAFPALGKPHEPLAQKPFYLAEICIFFDIISLNGKGAFQRPELGRES